MHTLLLLSPLLYVIALLPLQFFEPFTEPFANPMGSNLSISKMLETPQANGGFAALSSLCIFYLWTNPIEKTKEIYRISVVFTASWLLIILLPMNFAHYLLHNIIVSIAIVSFFLLILLYERRATAIQQKICRAMLLGYSLAALLVGICVILPDDLGIGFLLGEYILLFIVFAFLPLLKSF